MSRPQFTISKFYLLLLVLTSLGGFAQDVVNPAIDSLKTVANTSENDSLKLEALHEWDALIYWYDQDLDIELNQRMAKIASKNLHKDKSSSNYYSHMYATAKNNMGVAFTDRGEYKKAIESLMNCLKIATKVADFKLMADAHNNMGNIYAEQSNFSQATAHYENSLQLGIKAGNKQVEIASRGNLGSIFTSYADSALKANNLELEKLYLDSAITQYLATIENCEKEMQSDLSTYEQSAFPYYMIISMNSLASIHIRNNNLKEAEQLAIEALERGERINYKSAMASSLLILANLHFERNEIKSAIGVGEKAKNCALEVNDAVKLRESSFLLYNCYREIGNTSLALLNYEVYISKRDSIDNEANQKAAIEQIYKIEYEKKAVQDSIIALDIQKISEAQLGEKEAELKRQDQLIYGLLIFGVLVVIMVVFMYRVMNQRKRTYKIIRNQKQQSDLQKAKIVESITYAKQIQNSLLPKTEDIQKVLPGFSVFYRPKDIVSGDFYWFYQSEKTAYVVLSDCTGHGVPGAFMSMIGSTLLKEIIIDSRISNLAEILEKLDEGVRELLNQDKGSMTDDGMELGILKFHLDKDELEFASANQDLWVLRDELEQINGSVRSIGGWMRRRDVLQPFETHTIPLKGVSSIFISTDGFEDQFGGKSNEKFGREKFRELMRDSVSSVGLSRFEEQFDSWKGDKKQLDDVSVLRIDLKK